MNTRNIRSLKGLLAGLGLIATMAIAGPASAEVPVPPGQSFDLTKLKGAGKVVCTIVTTAVASGTKGAVENQIKNSAPKGPVTNGQAGRTAGAGGAAGAAVLLLTYKICEAAGA